MAELRSLLVGFIRLCRGAPAALADQMNRIVTAAHQPDRAWNDRLVCVRCSGWQKRVEWPCRDYTQAFRARMELAAAHRRPEFLPVDLEEQERT